MIHAQVCDAIVGFDGASKLGSYIHYQAFAGMELCKAILEYVWESFTMPNINKMAIILIMGSLSVQLVCPPTPSEQLLL